MREVDSSHGYVQGTKCHRFPIAVLERISSATSGRSLLQVLNALIERARGFRGLFRSFWFRLKAISRSTGFCPRTIRRALRALVRLGAIGYKCGHGRWVTRAWFTPEVLSRIESQNVPSPGPAHILSLMKQEKSHAPANSNGFLRIDLSELRTPNGRDAIWRRAVTASLAPDSQMGRLDVHRLALHALRYGRRPQVLLASNIRAGRWHFGTALDIGSDEHQALESMKGSVHHERSERKGFRLIGDLARSFLAKLTSAQAAPTS